MEYVYPLCVPAWKVDSWGQREKCGWGKMWEEKRMRLFREMSGGLVLPTDQSSEMHCYASRSL